ncbi:mge1 GrpE protein [Candida maltosa Xu316]|uniref:GrpE protein homolog n=1 Tax=Candida maltosa (strain Xu316) TaxID=1245528 RepID=M3JA55_CANMX|nr:GrpE-like protein [Candida maltosa Xu316]
MQRALLSPLTRSITARNTLRSTRLVTPRVRVSYPQSLAVRFNSTNAAKEEPKKETEASAKAETEAEAKSEEAEAEVNPLSELQEKLEKKDKELAAMKNHYARAIADFRHLQDTTKTEVQKAKDFALQKFAKDLLDSLDNFNLALSHVKEDTLKLNDEVKSLYDGVGMTKTVFEKTLIRYGIEKIDPLDQPFDPNLHEATFQIAHPDKEPGTVFHVQQVGYTLNDRVLRPAKVGVVKNDDE